MLTSLHVQNFKCLRDVKVEFGPLTVLIGPNDSGKSSILDALRLLGKTAAEPVGEVFKGENEWRHLVWKGKGSRPEITWCVGFHAKQQWEYLLELSQANTVTEHVRLRQEPKKWVHLVRSEPEDEDEEEEEYTALSDHLNSPPFFDKNNPGKHLARQCRHTLLSLAHAPRFRLSPERLRNEAIPAPAAVLSDAGENLVAVLDRLITGPDRSAIARLEQALHEAVPTLRGVALRTVDGKTGAKSLEFVLDMGSSKGPPVTIPCAHASDGAMLLTAFLALAFSDEPGLLLIEEPENGLHPSRLQSVVEMLRKISTGEVGNQPRQVILTTHSPLLLNYTRPEEVRIVQRDREKGTSVTPMSAVPDVHKLLEEFGAGELWYLLGEQGLVEGEKP